MITAYNTFVDSIQSMKSQFVNTYVTNEEFKKPLQTYIDAQTTFAKKVGQEAWNFTSAIGGSFYDFDAKKAFAVK